MTDPANPYQPPTGPIAAATTSDPLLPSRWKRLGAGLIDLLIGLVLSIPITIYQTQFMQIPWNQPVPVEHEVIVFLYSAAAFFAVNGYLLIKRGQTVGKLALGIKIATIYYTKPNLFTLTVVRTYLFWVAAYHPILALVGLLDILLIFGKNQRCLHDHVARTVVVDRSIEYNPG